MAAENIVEALSRIEHCRSERGTTLDLSVLGLTAVPAEVFALTWLTELNVSNNRLMALPPEIGKLTALTGLSLSFNQLTALPPEIGQLTALKNLTVSFNRLTALPPKIGNLTALRGLDVFCNQLTALPQEIGRLTALIRIEVHNNQLTALPPEFVKLIALTQLSLTDNPLRDPPLWVAAEGVAAVRRYFAFKERQRRGMWVVAGSRLSRHFRLRSRLAALETLLMIVAICFCGWKGWPQPVWAAAAVAPVLLLKTRASIWLGVRRFAELMRIVGLKVHEDGVRPLTLPFRLLVLGVGSIAIKLFTTPYCVVRNLSTALCAMPANLREQCLEIDLTCMPELLPGLERANDRDPSSAFLLTDLVCSYDRRIIGSSEYYDNLFNEPTRQTLLAAPILVVFFVIAMAYRLYVKAAAALYLPLLLIDVPDRGRLKVRTAADAKVGGALTKAAIQGAVAGLSLLALLALAGNDGLASAIGGFIDEKILKVWDATGVASLLPKLALTLLFGQAIVYLLGAGAETMARWARAGTAEGRLSPVARRWIGLASTFYSIHAGLIIVLLVSIFLVLAPNAILIVQKLWQFFF